MSEALTSEKFSRLMETIDGVGNRFGVAVSGGADSLALCLLAHEWAQDCGKLVYALSVDHGLRDGSAQECAWVAKMLNSYGIEHRTLHWLGDKPSHGIQASARGARYELLEAACIKEGIADIFLAHHLDDQAETFIMRLKRGSGVDGLSAMQKISIFKEVRVLRPLLDIPKSRLVGYLRSRKQEWIEDPSNENDDFERVKIRKAMAALNDLGLSPQRLGMTAQNMMRARKSLEGHTQIWLKENACLFEVGYVNLKSSAVGGRDDEIILRGLCRIGMCVGGGIYPPRFEKLQNLRKKLQSGQHATLSGCRWIVKGDDIIICRETRSNRSLVAFNPMETIFWDQRVIIEPIDNKYKIDNLSLRALGEDGWVDVVSAQPDLREIDLPLCVIHSLVSIWDKQGVSVVPQLGYKRVNFSVCLDRSVRVGFQPRIDLFK